MIINLFAPLLFTFFIHVRQLLSPVSTFTVDIEDGPETRLLSDQTGSQAKSGVRPNRGIRSNDKPGQTGSQDKSGLRPTAELDQTGSLDKRGPRTNGVPSSLPSPASFLQNFCTVKICAEWQHYRRIMGVPIDPIRYTPTA
jgi:hypothetical protein